MGTNNIYDELTNQRFGNESYSLYLEGLEHMASINDLKSSKFLKREDIGPGALVTITSVHQINVAKEGAPEEMKWCLEFAELDKPMVLNSTNGQIIAGITGISDDIENGWLGKKIVLYDDPNVTFGGKLVGGIRCRAARNQPAEKPAPVTPTHDLPF